MHRARSYRRNDRERRYDKQLADARRIAAELGADELLTGAELERAFVLRVLQIKREARRGLS